MRKKDKAVLEYAYELMLNGEHPYKQQTMIDYLFEIAEHSLIIQNTREEMLWKCLLYEYRYNYPMPKLETILIKKQ